MMREFLQHQKKGVCAVDEEYNSSNRGRPWSGGGSAMEHPELSLGPSSSFTADSSTATHSSSSSDQYSDANLARKRKCAWEEHPVAQSSSIELLFNDLPLPPDWEQCLDLQSGRMYYMNRRTLKKSWEWPTEEQKLDLELNISTPQNHDHARTTTTSSSMGSPRLLHHHHHDDDDDLMKKLFARQSSSTSSRNKMVAVPCLRCHLLVMLSTSSPSCPNCKFVHTLPASMKSPPPPPTTTKPLETLSLLN